MASDAASGSGQQRILVTGASGLVGRELCGVLAERGNAVVALLHRRRTLQRNDGTAIPTRRYDGAPRPGIVAVLDGDVTAEHFGLAPLVSSALAAGLDLVVHCAAVTDFNLAPATYDRVNVGGTARVLAFSAQACPAVPMLHVSTAYVCGYAEGSVQEAPTAAARFNNGYEASKAAAEALVLAAHRRGQPIAIARPSIVAGNWANGAISAFGSMYQLVRLVAEGLAGPLTASPGGSLNLVPIDYVVAALADIGERMALADGRIFHLAARDPVVLTALEALADLVKFRTPFLVSPEQFDITRLSPRQQRVHGQLMAPYACYLRRSPRFVAANIAELSGRCCPPTDSDYVRRLAQYAVATGFLRPAHRTSG
jgi:nucleoside-diphosphate-sugar epimerase